MAGPPVVRHFAAPTEAQFHSALVVGLARVAADIGRGTLADRSGRTTRGLDKLFEGSIPSGKGLLDFLVADETALDELLTLYGVKLYPRDARAAADMATVAEMAGVLARFADAISDGVRTHSETLSLAASLRPLLPKLTAIVAEADQMRGVEA